MLNKTYMIGHLGNDPERGFTTHNKEMTHFSLGLNETWKDKRTGERKQETTWVRIFCFGKLAENCAKYLTKGSKVYVEGSLKSTTRQLTVEGATPENVNVKSFHIKAGKVIFLHIKKKDQEYTQQEDQSYFNQDISQLATGPNDDDDLPF